MCFLIFQVPVFNKSEFDLEKLWRLVRDFGGSEKVLLCRSCVIVLELEKAWNIPLNGSVLRFQPCVHECSVRVPPTLRSHSLSVEDVVAFPNERESYSMREQESQLGIGMCCPLESAQIDVSVADWLCFRPATSFESDFPAYEDAYVVAGTKSDGNMAKTGRTLTWASNATAALSCGSMLI